jgi:hypothetical protein
MSFRCPHFPIPSVPTVPPLHFSAVGVREIANELLDVKRTIMKTILLRQLQLSSRYRPDLA